MLRFCGRTLVALVLTCAAASASSQTTTYRYDALGRVVQAVEGDGRSVNYAYDAAGNRLSLSDGVPSVELTVKAFTASSNAGGFTGLTATNGMRDQGFATKATSHVTTSESSAWIMADLGASQSINRVGVAGPDGAVTAQGAAALTGAVVEISDDAAVWALAASVGTVTPGVYKTISLGGGKARYVRLRRTNGLVGVGDFRLYSGGLRSNRSPVTVEDQVEVLKGQTLVFDPRFNDRDLDGDALSISAAGSGAAHGQVTFTATAITYKPDAAYDGIDRFSYAVIDTQGATAVGQVTVTVKDAPNRPPIVNDLGAATEVGAANAFVMVASDPDNDPLNIIAVLPTSAGGVVTPLGGLWFRYAPPEGFAGYDNFIVQVGDGRGQATMARVSIWVYRSGTANNAPVAFDDVITTSKGQALTYNPRGNDIDVDHDILTITAVQGSSIQGGSVARASDGGSLTYTPRGDFTGQDEFTYTIGDGRGGASSAKVKVNVVGSGNTSPTAEPDVWKTSVGATITADPRQNDNDLDGDVLTITALVQPAHGSAEIYLTGRMITYTPTAGYVGDDSFSYTVSDGRGGTVSAPINVTIKADGNRTPTALAQTYNIRAGEPFSFNPTVGAQDQDHDPITVISANMDDRDPAFPVKGTLSRAGAGPTNDELLSNYLIYTPPAGQTGFTVKALYIITDGHGQSIDGRGDSLSPPTAITINVGNYAAPAPVVQPGKLTAPAGGEKSITLVVDGSYSSLELGQAPPSGDVSFNGNRVTYRAAANFSGDADFTVKARGVGGLGPAALVDVTVGPKNSLPPPSNNANPDATPDTVSDVAYGTTRTIYVLSNDFDADGDTLTLNPTLPSPPRHGQAQVSGSAILYTPAVGYTGSDSFDYGVSDGKGGADAATVSLTILPQANRAPVAVGDSLTVPVGQTRSVSVLANDYDADGDSVSLSGVGTPAHGTATASGGAVTYTPAAGYAGSDSFGYTIVDGHGASANGVVSVTVLAPPNTSPTVTADSYATAFNSPAYLAVRDNDSDPDGDALTIASVTAPAHGTAVIAGGQVTYTPASGYSGSDAFAYTVSDGKGGSATATVSITVKSKINQVPTAANDTAATSLNTAKAIAVLSNDSDPDGDVLTISAVTQPAHGGAVIASGQITYTPTSGYLGSDSFGYTISDGKGGSASASVSITVQEANRAPTATDEAATIAFNSAKTIAVLVNDNDPDGDVLTITAVTTPAHGAAVIASGQITYTPATGYSGSDSFGYTISDGRGAMASATVNLTIEPKPNQAPVAVDDNAATDFETAKTIAVLANDSDPDGDAPTISTVTTPTHGSAVVASGQITYAPTTGYAGPDTFSYAISDGKGGTASATVAITVKAANRAPTATSDVVTVSFNTAKTIDVRANDNDPDGDPLTITAVTVPGHGTAAIADGKITYTPTSGYSGPDSFGYTIADGRGFSVSGTVSVTVRVQNRWPTARVEGYSVPRDTFTILPVLDNDTDEDGDPLRIIAVTPLTNLEGTSFVDGKVNVIGSGMAIDFTPDPSTPGVVRFTYTIADDQGGTASTYVELALTNNHWPVASDDLFLIKSNKQSPLPVLANDRDPDGDALRVRDMRPPQHGRVENAPGGYAYTPNTDYSGPDSFRYSVTDDRGAEVWATVELSIQPNTAPRPANDVVTTKENVQVAINVLANDTDPEADALSVVSVTNPAHGLVVRSGNTMTYYPTNAYRGPDSFSYTVDDGRGGQATALVSITVSAVNYPPVARGGDDYIPGTGRTALYIPNYVTDPNNDPLTVERVWGATRGRVEASGSFIIYTPNGYNSNGEDTFNYTVNDGNGGSATSFIKVRFDPEISPYMWPLAVDDRFQTSVGACVSYSLASNDFIFVSSETEYSYFYIKPTHGSVSVNQGGGVRYCPDPGFVGEDSFVYSVYGSGGASYATAFVTVGAGANRSPKTGADQASATGGRTNVLTKLLDNDSDPNGDPLTVISAQGARNGTLALGPNNTVTFTPPAGFFGTDWFTYTVSDGKGGVAEAAVYVNIGPNEPPKANQDWVTSRRSIGPITIDVLINDSDGNGDKVSIESVRQPLHGSVVVQDGKVIFTPHPSFANDNFEYTITDGFGLQSSTIVNLTLYP